MSNKNASLNPQQTTIVDSPIGCALALSSAGSGKTTVLTNRVLHLIRLGENPSKIVSVTFTNKAAREMKKRIETVVGKEGTKVIAGTFHSVCARLLRRFSDKVGINPKFAIADTSDTIAILKGLVPDDIDPKDALAVISNAKSKLMSPDDLANDTSKSYNETIAKIYREYEDRLQSMDMLDFDDLIVYAVRLFRSTNLAREVIDHLLVNLIFKIGQAVE